MPAFNDQISQLVDNFVAQVSALARRAAMDALEGALDAPTSARPSSRAGARPSSTLKLAPFASGTKRPADEIESMKARLLDYINENPGQRVEQINKALGTKTKDVALPLKKMITNGTIRSTGARRATAYFPVDGGSKAKRGRA
jgi:hypothetical protein